MKRLKSPNRTDRADRGYGFSGIVDYWSYRPDWCDWSAIHGAGANRPHGKHWPDRAYGRDRQHWCCWPYWPYREYWRCWPYWSWRSFGILGFFLGYNNPNSRSSKYSIFNYA